MSNNSNRRHFIKNLGLGTIGAGVSGTTVLEEITNETRQEKFTESKHQYNGAYTGEHLNRVAFPIGGIGAGMFCLEGTGSISHMSVRNRPEIFNEPGWFAAISIKGSKNIARV